MSDNATSTSKGNAVLEPSSTGSSSTLAEQLQIVKKKGAKPLGEPPVITAFKANSGLMSRVHNFLPEMARAEDALKARVAAGESIDVEDVSGTDKVIEMNVGILANEGKEGTSDSDSDSSTSHDDANNEYTSDSDLDSSSSDTTESSSSSASDKDIKLKMPNQSSSNKKRPLIQVLNENESINCDASDEESSRGAGKSGKFGQ